MSTPHDKSHEKNRDAARTPGSALWSSLRRLRSRKLFSTAIALAILAAIALVFLPHLIPDRSLKALFESQLAKDLGREVAIEGVEWPKWSCIKLRGLDIRARKGFGRHPLVSIQRLELSYRLAPLLLGRLAIDELDIDSPKFSIKKSESGELCVADLIGKPPPPLSIERLALKNGRCEFTDKASGQTLLARKIQLTLSRYDPDEPTLYKVKLEIVDAGEPAEIEATGEFQAPSGGQGSSSGAPEKGPFLFNGKVKFSGLNFSRKLPAEGAGSVREGVRLLGFELKDASGEANIDIRTPPNPTSSKEPASSDGDSLKASLSAKARLANLVLDMTNPTRQVQNSPGLKKQAERNESVVLALGGVALASVIECDLSMSNAPTGEKNGASGRASPGSSMIPRSVRVKSLSLESDVGDLTTSGSFTFEKGIPKTSALSLKDDVSVDLTADVTLDTDKALALLAPFVSSLQEGLMLSGKTRIRLLSVKGRPSDLAVVGHLDMTDNDIRYAGISGAAGSQQDVQSKRGKPAARHRGAGRSQAAGRNVGGKNADSNNGAQSGQARHIKRAKEPATVDFEVALKPDAVELKELRVKSAPVNGLVSAKFQQTKEGPLVDVGDLDLQLKTESLLSMLPPESFALPDELKVSGWARIKASGKALPNRSYADASILLDLTNNAVTYVPARQLQALKSVSRSAKGPKIEAVTARIKELTPVVIKRKNDTETVDLKIVLRKSEDAAPSTRANPDAAPQGNVIEIKRLTWKSYIGLVNLSGKVRLPLESSEYDLNADAQIDVERLKRFSPKRKSLNEARESKDWNISGKSRLTLKVKGTTDEKATPKTLSVNGALDLTNNSVVYTGTAIKPAGEEITIDFSADATENRVRLKQLALVTPTDTVVLSGEAKGDGALRRAMQVEDFDSFAITMRSNLDAGRLLRRVPELLLSRRQIPTVPEDLRITGKTQCLVSVEGTPDAFDFNCSIDMSRNAVAFADLFNKPAREGNAKREGTLGLSFKGKWRSQSAKPSRGSSDHADGVVLRKAKSATGSATEHKAEGVARLGELSLTDSRLAIGNAVFTAEGRIPVSFPEQGGSAAPPRSAAESHLNGHRLPANASLSFTGRAPRLDSLAAMFPFLKGCKFAGGLAFNMRTVGVPPTASQLSGSLSFDDASVSCDSDATTTGTHPVSLDSTPDGGSSSIGIDGRIDITPTTLAFDKLKLRVNKSVILASTNFERARRSDNSATADEQSESVKLTTSLESEKIDADSIALAIKRMQERWKRATEGLREKKAKKVAAEQAAASSLEPASPNGVAPTTPKADARTPQWLTAARSLSFSGDLKVGELLVGKLDSTADGEAEGIEGDKAASPDAAKALPPDSPAFPAEKSDESLVLGSDKPPAPSSHEFQIRNLNAPITLEDGVLKVAGLSLSLNDGQIVADVEARLNPPSAEVDASDGAGTKGELPKAKGDGAPEEDGSKQGMTFDLDVKATGITVADNVRGFLKSVFPNLKGGDRFDFESHGKGDIIVKEDPLEALEASFNTQRGESILDVTGGYMEGQGATDVMVKLFPALKETRYPLKSTHIVSEFSPEECHSKMYFDGQSIDMYMEGTTNNVTKEIDYWMSVDLVANLGLSSVRDKMPGPIRSASLIDIMHFTGKIDDQHVDFLEPKKEEVAEKLKGLFLVKDAITLFNPQMSPKEKTRFFQGRMQLLFGPAKVLKDGAPEIFTIYKKIGRLIKGPFSLFKWKKKTENQTDSGD